MLTICHLENSKFTVRGRESYRKNKEMSTNNSEEEYISESNAENDSSESSDTEIINSSHNVKHEEQKNQSGYLKKKTYVVSSIAIVLVLIAIAIGCYSSNLNDLDILKKKFPNQPNETFEYFETIVHDALFTKPVHPAVFLFLYDDNESKVNNLIDHLAKYASQKLEISEDYIDVGKNEFLSSEALKDYGYLINKYKIDLLEKQVMVVKNLQDIPAKVAQVFHSFCDEISPLVDRVVYIFTLKVDSMNGKEERIAETNLKKYWKNLDNDILIPLITRVTSTVLKVK